MYKKGYLISGEKNGRFDHTIYKIKNIETEEILEDYTYNLLQLPDMKRNLRNLLKGYSKQYKNWIVL